MTLCPICSTETDRENVDRIFSYWSHLTYRHTKEQLVNYVMKERTKK